MPLRIQRKILSIQNNVSLAVRHILSVKSISLGGNYHSRMPYGSNALFLDSELQRIFLSLLKSSSLLF
jgi:hypothetical protein